MDPQETREILETKALLDLPAPWDPMVTPEHRLAVLTVQVIACMHSECHLFTPLLGLTRCPGTQWSWWPTGTSGMW